MEIGATKRPNTRLGLTSGACEQARWTGLVRDKMYVLIPNNNTVTFPPSSNNIVLPFSPGIRTLCVVLILSQTVSLNLQHRTPCLLDPVTNLVEAGSQKIGVSAAVCSHSAKPSLPHQYCPAQVSYLLHKTQQYTFCELGCPSHLLLSPT